MGRLVQRPRLKVYQSGLESRRPQLETTDRYLDRLAKYVPAEATGAYLAAENLLKSEVERQSAAVNSLAQGFSQFANNLPTLDGLIFIMCLIFAPAYVMVMGRRTGNSAWVPQAFIAALAFVIWAYAIGGGVFANAHSPDLAGILLIGFSMMIALYQPEPETPYLD